MIPAEAYIISLPDAVVKAHEDGGKRIIEVEASNESVDSEGDIVLQKALLDSADSFVRSGHLDIDHLSEIGHRIGITNPTSYIIGRPTEVKDLGKKCTGVVGEIMRSSDGKANSDVNKYDAFWKSLQSDPPVRWSASIYGFPTDIDNCSDKACSVSGVTRYVIKSIDWRSLALTRKPINTSLKGYAKVITAKAFADELLKAENMMPAPVQSCGYHQCPTTLDALWGNYQRHKDQCGYMQHGNSVMAFRDHFLMCCGAPSDVADMLAHALMYLCVRDRRRS